MIFGAYGRDLVLVKNCARCAEGSVCQGGQSVDIVDEREKEDASIFGGDDQTTSRSLPPSTIYRHSRVSVHCITTMYGAKRTRHRAPSPLSRLRTYFP